MVKEDGVRLDEQRSEKVCQSALVSFQRGTKGLRIAGLHCK